MNWFKTTVRVIYILPLGHNSQTQYPFCTDSLVTHGCVSMFNQISSGPCQRWKWYEIILTHGHRSYDMGGTFTNYYLELYGTLYFYHIKISALVYPLSTLFRALCQWFITKSIPLAHRENAQWNSIPRFHFYPGWFWHTHTHTHECANSACK